MSDSNRVVVSDGTGTTGRACSRAQAAAGHEVTATAPDRHGAAALAGSALADEAIEPAGPLSQTSSDPSRRAQASVDGFPGAEFAPVSAGAAERS